LIVQFVHDIERAGDDIGGQSDESPERGSWILANRRPAAQKLAGSPFVNQQWAVR
jgi:hypothetical protein